ncbi:MAG: hypothetical protein RIQ47_1974 [Bacteroidota bacterium]
MNKPEIRQHVSLKPYNTFGLSVNAEYFAEINSILELKAVLENPMLKELALLILGGGSNILFTKDVKGLVLFDRIKVIEVVEETSEFVLIKAGAGLIWHDLVLYSVEHGWGGLENLSLIPGTVGAAPIQNIGAYGVEIKDTFVELEALHLDEKQLVSFKLDDCEFGYRDSIFKRSAKGKYMIVSVTFRLSKNPVLNTRYGAIEQQLTVMGISTPTVQSVSDAVIAIRTSKLPDPKVIGNAGSFFKNPEISLVQFEKLKEAFPEIVAYPTSGNQVKIAAGWLIEKAGWKGKVIGNVGMHSQQALVLVNHGGATGEELLLHATRVQQDIENKFGIQLEMEVNIL